MQVHGLMARITNVRKQIQVKQKQRLRINIELQRLSRKVNSLLTLKLMEAKLVCILTHVYFYVYFQRIQCTPTHISLFQMKTQEKN